MCIESNCPNDVKVRARGLCCAHYHRLQRQGPLPPLERFWPKVDKGESCWSWTGHRNRDGYGTYGGRLAHRIAYERSVGPIPSGMTIDHLCRNHACVRPEHLRILSPHENYSDNSWRGRTECINGHTWSPENTRMRVRNGREHRVCRPCERGRQRAMVARRP